MVSIHGENTDEGISKMVIILKQEQVSEYDKDEKSNGERGS